MENKLLKPIPADEEQLCYGLIGELKLEYAALWTIYNLLLLLLIIYYYYFFIYYYY